MALVSDGSAIATVVGTGQSYCLFLVVCFPNAKDTNGPIRKSTRSDRVSIQPSLSRGNWLITSPIGPLISDVTA